MKIDVMQKIDDALLLKICRQFRYGIIASRSSKKQCKRVCVPLHQYLLFLKIKCQLIEGYVTIGERITNHFWIRLADGRIVCPTADQFNDIKGKDMPKIYLGVKPDHYMEKKKGHK